MQEKALSLLFEFQTNLAKEYLALFSKTFPCTISDFLSLPFPKSLNFILKKQIFFTFKKRIEKGSNQESDCLFDIDTFSLKEWGNFENVFQRIALQERFVKTVLQKAIQEYVQFLIAPKSYWVNQIFGGEAYSNPDRKVKVEAVKTLLISLNDYPYLTNVFFQYLERKQLTEISVERFEKIIGDIDRKVISTFNVEDFQTLLTPFLVFPDQKEKLLPIELFRLFFYEKELYRETEIFQNALNRGVLQVSLYEAIELISGKEITRMSKVDVKQSEPTKEDDRIELNIDKPLVKPQIPRQEEDNVTSVILTESMQQPSLEKQEQTVLIQDVETENKESETNPPSIEKIDSENSLKSKSLEGIQPSEAFQKLFQAEDLQKLRDEIAKREANQSNSEKEEKHNEEMLFEKESLQTVFSETNSIKVQQEESKEKLTSKDVKGDDYPPFDISSQVPVQAKSFEELLKAIKEKSEKIHQKRDIEKQESEALEQNQNQPVSPLASLDVNEIHAEQTNPHVDISTRKDSFSASEDTEQRLSEKTPQEDIKANQEPIQIVNEVVELQKTIDRNEPSKSSPSLLNQSVMNAPVISERKEPLSGDSFAYEPFKPLLAPERSVSIETLFSHDEKKRIVKKVFRGNGDDFDNSVLKLDSCKTWREASIFIDQEIFTRFKVDEYSEEAILFTDYVFNHFFTK
ncbi:MAG: hypothetical protein SFU91_09670 [Chloroherpetonaceae bacterium]|nr:hypothetical protein [Chloroherpetonaceae bacterium]